MGNNTPGNKNRSLILSVGHTLLKNGAYSEELKISEFGVNFLVANTIHGILTENQINVSMLSNIRIYDKLRVIEQDKPNFVIEVHHNAFNKKCTGFLFMYKKGDKEGKELGESICGHVKYTNIRPCIEVVDIKGNYLIWNSPVSTIIIECSFIDNMPDFSNEITHFEGVTKQLADGILAYLNA